MPAACTTAVISVAGASLVEPFAVVSLDGTQSTSPLGAITAYEWTIVSHPGGFHPRLSPSAGSPAPTLRLDRVGTYVVELRVADAGGRDDCTVDQVTLEAVPDEPIYVELVWDTPGDANPEDVGMGVGADVDLHLQHPLAVGEDIDTDGMPDGWFDMTYDCSWQNIAPDWGMSGSAEDPRLVRDDPDGAGPEVIAIEEPETAVYRIGVHYIDDHAFGLSEVSVRIYVNGVVAHDSPLVELAELDFWTVADIDWPSGTVVLLDNGLGAWDIASGVIAP